MKNSIQEQINILVRLQNIEDKIRIIKARMDEEEDKFKRINSRVEMSEKKFSSIQSSLSDLREEYRAYESDSRLWTDQIDKSNSKLISVKTNREYSSVLKEIDVLKAKILENDEKMIFCLDSIENAEKDSAARKDEHEIIEKDVRNDKRRLEKEISDYRKRLLGLEKEKVQVSEKIETELLSQFMSIKKNGNGIGIARAIDAICQACNMNIPPQMYNELQGLDSFKRCPFCHRIIYWQK